MRNIGDLAIHWGIVCIAEIGSKCLGAWHAIKRFELFALKLYSLMYFYSRGSLMFAILISSIVLLDS